MGFGRYGTCPRRDITALLSSMKEKKAKLSRSGMHGYDAVLTDVVHLIETARSAAARSVNAVITATYWAIGRSIVEEEQRGLARTDYGEEIVISLSRDLQARFGRGFGRANLFQMKAFFLAYRNIVQTVPGLSDGKEPVKIVQTPSGLSGATIDLGTVAAKFKLPWSHYVRLLSIRGPEARHFYETEALRGGWTVRQLDRQIGTQFFERTALSRNKTAMLRKGQVATPDDVVTPEEEIKQPYVLEFLNLKDEYSETDLEAALIAKLETFLLELGGDFTFVGRQESLAGGRRMVPNRSALFPPPTTVPGHRRSQARQVHARRRRTDAPLPQLRSRALDACWRETTGRTHPVRRERQRRGQVRARRPAE